MAWIEEHITVDDSTLQKVAGQISMKDDGTTASKLAVPYSGVLWPAADKTPIYINPCDGGADAAFATTWRVIRSLDTDNYKTFLINKQGIKMAGDGVNPNGQCAETFGAPKNLSAAYAFMIRYYVHPGSGNSSYTYLSRLHFHLVDAAGNAGWTIYHNNWTGTQPGWHEVIVTRSNVTSGAIADYSAITGMHFFLYRTSAARTPAVTIDSIIALPKLATPRVFLTFDDGWDDHYEAWQRMNAYGLVGSFFVVTDTVGTNDATYLNWDQCREMQASGSLIGNHTKTHTTWYTESLANKITDVVGASDAMAAQGVGRGMRILATPGGGYNEDPDEVSIMEHYVDVIRLTKQPATALDGRLWYPWGWNKRRVFSSHTNGLTTDGVRDDIEAQFDDAIADGGCAVITLHRIIEAAEWTRFDHILANLKAHCDAGDCVCSTLADVPLIT